MQRQCFSTPWYKTGQGRGGVGAAWPRDECNWHEGPMKLVEEDLFGEPCGLSFESDKYCQLSKSKPRSSLQLTSVVWPVRHSPVAHPCSSMAHCFKNVTSDRLEHSWGATGIQRILMSSFFFFLWDHIPSALEAGSFYFILGHNRGAGLSSQSQWLVLKNEDSQHACHSTKVDRRGCIKS